MSEEVISLPNSDYTIAWITGCPHERAAAEAMLDRTHGSPQNPLQGDQNIYTLGSIRSQLREHNIVIVSLPSGHYRPISVGMAAGQMLCSFPNIKFNLKVGTGGCIPNSEHDIRLGDVVVSKPKGPRRGVRRYNLRGTPPALEPESEEDQPLQATPRVLLNAVNVLIAHHDMRGSDIPKLLETMYRTHPDMERPRSGPGYVHQGQDNDNLFLPSYEHIKGERNCDKCDKTMIVQREDRPYLEPDIHQGFIASVPKIITNARVRDALKDECLCFEAKATGLMEQLPCLVIQGISHYSDSHQNDQWQRYAAATAAAYTKELLHLVPVQDSKQYVDYKCLMEEAASLRLSPTRKIEDQMPNNA